MKHCTQLITFVSLLSLTILANAQTPPPLLNYQGQIQNPDGTVPVTADYTLTFRIYDTPNSVSGALIWGPQIFDGVAGQGHGARIPVVQGFFNVMLGAFDTTGRSLATAFDGTSRYIEITVSTRPAITPRQQLVTAPFAFRAAKSDNSDKLAGFDWSALLNANNPATGTLHPARIAVDSLGSDKLANNSVGTVELQNNAVTTDKIADNAVNAAKIANGSVTGDEIADGTLGSTDLNSSVNNALVPSGVIIAFGGTTVPPGWTLCDGKSLNRLQNLTLFTAIGTAWGSVNSTTFRVPDLRGMFLRGVSGNRVDTYEDPDRLSRTASATGGNTGNAVGSIQADQLAAHSHGYLDSNPDANSGASVDAFANGTDDLWQEDRQRTTASAGGSETRPKNVYVNYIIKL